MMLNSWRTFLRFLFLKFRADRHQERSHPSSMSRSPEVVQPHYSNEGGEDELQEAIQVLMNVDLHRLDAKVRIWSTKPILNEASEASGRPPKSLSTLTMHTGPVLVVRWAHSGRWLASGSDDEIVMVWDLDPYADISNKPWSKLNERQTYTREGLGLGRSERGGLEAIEASTWARKW